MATFITCVNRCGVVVLLFSTDGGDGWNEGNDPIGACVSRTF